jgi:hypothetical protein
LEQTASEKREETEMRVAFLFVTEEKMVKGEGVEIIDVCKIVEEGKTLYIKVGLAEEEDVEREEFGRKIGELRRKYVEMLKPHKDQIVLLAVRR